MTYTHFLLFVGVCGYLVRVLVVLLCNAAACRTMRIQSCLHVSECVDDCSTTYVIRSSFKTDNHLN